MEKVEYYTIRPNLKQIYGRKVNKNTYFEEKTENNKVHQTFKDLTLTSIIEEENEVNGFKIKEYSKIEVTVPENTILIWSEEEGFIIPQAQVCTLEDIENQIKDIKEIYNGGDTNDTKGNENKNI